MEIERGTCHALFVYDVAASINLAECERRIAASQRAIIRHQRRAPRYFEYYSAPLRIVQDAAALTIGHYATRPSVDIVFYDFGAVLVSYSIPLEGPLAGLRALSDALYDNADLLADSRARVEALIELFSGAMTRPEITDFVEDYVIFEIAALSEPGTIPTLHQSQGPLLAQILRATAEDLSQDEISDALSHRISFGTDDIVIVDWNAAILFDPHAEDVRAVLEFANVELLEMRFLDRRLDHALERSYVALTARKRRLTLFRGRDADLHRIGEWQVDSAILFEGVNNALKLLGDQYLARVYRLVSERFHLSEWDSSILRKIETLKSIYEKISDRVTNKRMEALEWIIIILIFVSIVLPFLGGTATH